jgi:hypothetical protein
MSDVFLSYRRDDAASATGRLADRLAQEFGPEHIFRDVESIAAGEDFLERILAALHQAKLMIVVIGPRWLDAHDAAGARRLECPDDYVRLEIRSALGMELPLIPVLVDGARVPRITELPEDLKPLASRHAIELTDRGWGSETNDLLRVLTERYGVSPGGNVHSPIIWDAIVAWPRNLFDFVTDPARFLARKVLDTHASLARASVFWILSLAIGLPCQSLITHFEDGSVFEIATILA